MSPDELATLLRDVRAPGEDEAAARAWSQIAAEPLHDTAHAARDPHRAANRLDPAPRAPHRAANPARPAPRAPSRALNRLRRAPRVLERPHGRVRLAPWRLRFAPAGIALAILAALAVGAFTPPGEAVADWLRRAVERPKPAAKPAPALALPAGGAVLVAAPGGLWIVDADGDRHRLGRWDAASWSPSGRFVAAVHGQRLAALDRRGHVRWSLTRPFALAQPVWSPDRFHVAYRSGNGLRVVAGDGTGDRFVAGALGPAAPVWQPGSRPVVTWADHRRRVRAADAVSARELWTSAPGPAVRFLAWSADGARLAAVSRRAVRFYDARGHLLRRLRLPAGMSVDAAAFSRQGALLTLALHDARRGFSQVVTTPAGRHPGSLRPLFGGRGRIGELVYSPPGGWLLVAWRGADEWVFLRTPAVDRVRAVGAVTRRLEPGASAYPRVLGWCCPP
jgi:hypothetical protein